MFLVRTDPKNANRNSLTINLITITRAFKGIKSYIQIGDSVRFLSKKIK